MSDDDEFNDDNFSSSTSKVDEATSSSNLTDDTNNITITDDNASIVVGLWKMINCEVKSGPPIQVVESLMDVKLNEEKTELLSHTTWTVQYKYCLPCIKFRGKETSIIRLTGVKNEFKEYKTDGKTIRYHGRIENNGNTFISVGERGTNVAEYVGDRCYMKVVDARYSSVMIYEWERESV